MPVFVNFTGLVCLFVRTATEIEQMCIFIELVRTSWNNVLHKCCVFCGSACTITETSKQHVRTTHRYNCSRARLFSRRMSSGARSNFKLGEGEGAHVFRSCPSTFLATQVQLVSAFVMVSTVWSVSRLLFFYWRCPLRAQPFVKLGGGTMESTPLRMYDPLQSLSGAVWPQSSTLLQGSASYSWCVAPNNIWPQWLLYTGTGRSHPKVSIFARSKGPDPATVQADGGPHQVFPRKKRR